MTEGRTKGRKIPLPEVGAIYTFYSYKGGVGRSMAMANVGALLAQWGKRVLLVDFDLEAPGLERFFGEEATAQGQDRHGLVDMMLGVAKGEELDWRKCLIDVAEPGSAGRLAVLGAGRQDGDYQSRVQSLDWRSLFNDHGIGDYFLDLREQWIDASDPDGFDFVLVDSRTGVTDIGGLCTALLPDDVVLLFTTTKQSYLGVLDIARRARKARERIPRDLPSQRFVPVPSRDEALTEWNENRQWRKTFAEELAELYEPWLPEGVDPWTAMSKLHIPYVPVWSYGESLPVRVAPDELDKPGTIGSAYGRLATLLLHRIHWSRLGGELTAYEVEELYRRAREAKEELRRRNEEMDVERRRAEREAEQALQRAEDRAHAYRLGLMGVVSIGVLVGVGLGIQSLRERAKVDEVEQRRKVAADVMESFEEVPDASTRFALVAALRGYPDPGDDKWRGRLFSAWKDEPPIATLELPEQARIRGGSISEDGNWVAWFGRTDLRVKDLGKATPQEVPRTKQARYRRADLVGAAPWMVVEYETSELEVWRVADPAEAPLWGSDGGVSMWRAATGSSAVIVLAADGTPIVVDGDADHALEPASAEQWEPLSVGISPDGDVAYVHYSFEPVGEGDASEEVWVYHEASDWARVAELPGKPFALGNTGVLVREEDSIHAWSSGASEGGVEDVALAPSFERAVFTADDRVVAWTKQQDAYVLEEDGTMTKVEPSARPELLASPMLSRDGKRVVGDGRIVDVWTGKELLNLGEKRAVISGNGKHVLAFDDKELALVALDGSRRILTVPKGVRLSGAAIDDSGRFVAAELEEGNIDEERYRVALFDTRTNAERVVDVGRDMIYRVGVFANPTEGTGGFVIWETSEDMVALRFDSSLAKVTEHRLEDSPSLVRIRGTKAILEFQGELQEWEPGKGEPRALTTPPESQLRRVRLSFRDEVSIGRAARITTLGNTVEVLWRSGDGVVHTYGQDPSNMWVADERPAFLVQESGLLRYSELTRDGKWRHSETDWSYESAVGVVAPDLGTVFLVGDESTEVWWPRASTEEPRRGPLKSDGKDVVVSELSLSDDGRTALAVGRDVVWLLEIDPEAVQVEPRQLELPHDDIALARSGLYVATGEGFGLDLARQLDSSWTRASSASCSRAVAWAIGRRTRADWSSPPPWLQSALERCVEETTNPDCSTAAEYLADRVEEQRAGLPPSAALEDLEECKGTGQVMGRRRSEVSIADRSVRVETIVDLRDGANVQLPVPEYGPKATLLAWRDKYLIVSEERDRVEVWAARKSDDLVNSLSWEEAVDKFATRASRCLSDRERRYWLGQDEGEAKRTYDECVDARKARQGTTGE